MRQREAREANERKRIAHEAKKAARALAKEQSSKQGVVGGAA